MGLSITVKKKTDSKGQPRILGGGFFLPHIIFLEYWFFSYYNANRINKVKLMGK